MGNELTDIEINDSSKHKFNSINVLESTLYQQTNAGILL